MVLVAFLILCDLTVTKLRNTKWPYSVCQHCASKSLILPCEANNNDDETLRDMVCKLSYFTSWLSLNSGIETCFYNGMNMYSKVWLQFVFPVYIWLIIILIIIASNYNLKASRLFGRNSTKILATLFLLSYAKILDAVFTALSFTFLDYPDGRQVVWQYKLLPRKTHRSLYTSSNLYFSLFNSLHHHCAFPSSA